MQTTVQETTSSHLTGYVKGFMLALALSVLAFGLVIVGTDMPLHGVELVSGKLLNLPVWFMTAGILVLGILQLLVHLHYFLHLDFSPGQRWNLLALAFTLLLIVIMAGGTIWVMYNMNYMMMPGMDG